MPVIDMHLNPLVHPELAQLTSVSGADLVHACRHYASAFGPLSTRRGVMVLLNPAILDDAAADLDVAAVLRTPEFVFALAVDFRVAGAVARLELARALGVRALKFHPYIQRIEGGDFARAAEVAHAAEALGMFVMVCCAHGTRALDRHSGVRLAAHLSDHVGCPIVMSHAGGARVLDAMLAAADAPNLYLDTSFSLPYYIGSSVEGDLAFAMRKLGTERWLYGSDAPFMKPDEALQITLDFLDRHRFSARDVDNLMHGTAARLLDATAGRGEGRG